MDYNHLIGVEIKSAIKDLDREDVDYRIVSIDGKGMIITCDFKMERLNLYVVDNKITNITLG